MVQKLIEILNKQLKPIFKKCGEFSIKKENILGVVLKDNEIQIIELLKKKSSWFAKGYTYQQIAGIGKDQDIFSASTYLSDQVKNALDGDTYNIGTVAAQTATGGSIISGLTITLTPSSTSSKILIMLTLYAVGHKNYMQYANVTWQPSGGTESAITSSNARGITTRFDGGSTSTNIRGSTGATLMISPATTSAITFRVRAAISSGTSNNLYINRTAANNTNADDGGYTVSSLTVFELEGSVSSQAYTGATATKT